VYAFGDFRFDSATGELTRGDAVERLAPQTALVLRVLVERSGEVISRDEFRRRVWPNATVEFDQGLNFSIRQLRIALGDDAAAPTYIETLPRRGYRFRARVVRDEVDAVQPDSPSAQTGAGRRVIAQRWAALALAIVVFGGAVAWVAHRSGRAPVLAIVPFDADSTVPGLAEYRDELSESLVERLTSRLGASAVIVGPAMTKRFGSRTPIDSIHATLGAAYAISGVVRRRANGVDIFAQYVRAKDRGHVWGFRVLDSTAHRDAEIGAHIADSVAAIVLSPTPRAARGFERPVKPR